MMSHFPNIWTAALLVLAGSVLSTVAEAATLEEVQQDRIETLVAELVPVVEAEAGRRFKVIPPIVLATPDQLSDVLYLEQVHLLTAIAGIETQQAEHAARITSQEMSSAFVGKYGFIDKNLYVMTDGIAFALAAHGASIDLVEPVIEVVLAHELVHALQDQYADLGAVVTSRSDGDGVVAVNCTVESHAVWVHERVGRARGHTEAVDVVAAILGYDIDSPGISTDPHQFYTSYVYGQGRNFVDWQVLHRGPEAIWQVLKNPPANSAMIVSPSTYSPTSSPQWSARIRHRINGAERKLTPKQWDQANEPVGDYDLRERLVATGRGHRLAESFVEGWSSRSSVGPLQWARIELLYFHDEHAARDYVARLRLQAQVDLAMAMPPITSAVTAAPGLDGRVGTFEPLSEDDAAEEHITIRRPNDSQEYRTVWVSRGAYVVQVQLVNHTVSDRRMTKAINKVFRSVH